MSAPSDPSAQIARSWDANAPGWTRLIRARSLESRRLATDRAIIDAVVDLGPGRVLDVGCGEGWLCRALTERGCPCVGIDGSAALVAAARAAGGGEFLHLSYEELGARPEGVGLTSFDLIVCNFSLLQEDLNGLLKSLKLLVEPEGALIIQTVHPWSARGDGAYADGWRVERFEGFSGELEEPMPWFFRTLASWARVLRDAGFAIEGISEPEHPVSGEPLSLIIAARPWRV